MVFGGVALCSRPPKGFTVTSRLRILTPGLGAVSTTLMAGVMLSRKGLSRPVGSVTEYADVDGTPMTDFVAGLDEARRQ